MSPRTRKVKRSTGKKFIDPSVEITLADHDPETFAVPCPYCGVDLTQAYIRYHGWHLQASREGTLREMIEMARDNVRKILDTPHKRLFREIHRCPTVRARIQRWWAGR
jgi:hypothetical protein